MLNHRSEIDEFCSLFTWNENISSDICVHVLKTAHSRYIFLICFLTNYFYSISVSKAKIVGNPELYIKSGSDINLTCIVLQTPDPPSFIYWYRGAKVINYSQRGGISVVTEKQTRTSRLLISRALPTDSGNYTCSPSSSDAASVLVHVLNGEQPAAMQHGNNSSTGICWTIDLLLIVFLQCFILER